MRFYRIPDSLLDQQPNLIDIMWTNPDKRIESATYYVPESHANIALIAMMTDPTDGIDHLAEGTRILTII
jgi:hypothetical protein